MFVLGVLKVLAQNQDFSLIKSRYTDDNVHGHLAVQPSDVDRWIKHRNTICVVIRLFILPCCAPLVVVRIDNISTPRQVGLDCMSDLHEQKRMPPRLAGPP